MTQTFLPPGKVKFQHKHDDRQDRKTYPVYRTVNQILIADKSQAQHNNNLQQDH